MIIDTIYGKTVNTVTTFNFDLEEIITVAPSKGKKHSHAYW